MEFNTIYTANPIPTTGCQKKLEIYDDQKLFLTRASEVIHSLSIYGTDDELEDAEEDQGENHTGINDPLSSKVRKRKEYRNPYFLQHVATYQDIDQIGSCFSKDLFDPHGYDKSDFYDEIKEAA